MKNNKVVLPLIIVLLLCFLPLSAYGLYSNFFKANNSSKDNENPNHLPKVGNVLYFYQNNTLKGTFNCIDEDCNEASLTGSDQENENIGIFYEDYVFIKDGEIIKLYNLNTNMTLLEFNKIYKYSSDNEKVITENKDNLYGIFNTKTFLYDLEAIYNKIISKKDSSSLIVNKENKWYLIDENKNEISSYLDYEIFDFDDNYIYCKDNDLIKIYNYQGIQKLTDVHIKSYDVYKDYNIIVDTNNNISLYDKFYNYVNRNYRANNSNLIYEKNENSLKIIKDGEIIDTIN